MSHRPRTLAILMFCLGCSRPSRLLLCDGCVGGLCRARPRTVGSIPVGAAFRHDGLARDLIHELKYRSVRPVARLMATEMVRHLPAATSAFVPVPRVTMRRLKLGVDAAAELASALSHLTGIPTIAALRAPAWSPGHAGRSAAARRPAGLRRRRPAPAGSVLVDDVVTTGATLRSAAAACGPAVIGAVTATSASV